VEIEDPAGQGEPCNGEKQQREKKTAGRADVRSRAEKGLERVKEQEDGNEQDGKARPVMQREPGERERQVEPAGNQEMKEEGGEGRGEKHKRLG